MALNIYSTQTGNWHRYTQMMDLFMLILTLTGHWLLDIYSLINVGGLKKGQVSEEEKKIIFFLRTILI